MMLKVEKSKKQYPESVSSDLSRRNIIVLSTPIPSCYVNCNGSIHDFAEIDKDKDQPLQGLHQV